MVVYLLEGIASRSSHAELVQNPEDLELMCRWRIAPRGKLRLLGNGVDLERFTPPSADDGRGCETSWGSQPRTLSSGLWHGSLMRRGVPELIEAVDRLGPPFRLLLIGPHDPAKANALPAHWLDRALAGGAVVLGHRQDTERLYGAMDLFCLPSHREGFPRAAIGGGCDRLPVVATDIRGCRQVVDPGVTGALVPVRDAQALAAGIESHLDEGQRTGHGAAARTKAEAEFDERAMVTPVLAAY